MKVLGYVRVSTQVQADEGLGLDVQEQAIRAWTKANGHRLVGIAREEGVSGSNGIETRRALPEALMQLRAGKAQGLVVYRLDRLARDLVLQEQLLAEIKKMGAEVFSTSPSEANFLGDDPNDPSRKLIRQVLGAVAEYERAMIGLRTRMGRARKAEMGGFAYGSPPYGYRAVNRQLSEQPEEQKALAEIRRMKAEGKSLRAIAQDLEDQGFAPPRGKRWHPETLRLITSRESQVTDTAARAS